MNTHELSEFTELIAQLVNDFVPHGEFRRYRVPHRPTPLDPICDHLGLHRKKDPHAISRNLFRLKGNSRRSGNWHLYILRLPSGKRAHWVDEANGRRIIAVGPGGSGSDLWFARALFRSNGEDFGTVILDSAPSRVFTNFRGDVLVPMFLDAFHCSDHAWEVLDFLGRSGVRRWLRDTLEGGKEMREPKRLTKKEAQQEFLALVEQLVSDFTPHPEEARVGVPRRFTPTYPLAKFVGTSPSRLPHDISRGLIRFVWWGAPGSAASLEINAFTLPSGPSVLWIETDFGDEEQQDRRYIVASGAPEITDERLIEALFTSDGEQFNAESVTNSPPLEISTNLPRGEFLINLFTAAFTKTDAWDCLRAYQPDDGRLNTDDPVQRRELVERYLAAVLT